MERRGRHELLRAQQRLHLVDGFLAAMRDLDAVVQAIRQASDAAAAGAALQAQPFGLSREQAEGVLGMTLRRLTSLESNKLQEEQAQLRARWVRTQLVGQWGSGAVGQWGAAVFGCTSRACSTAAGAGQHW